MKVTPTCYQQPILSFLPFFYFVFLFFFSPILQSMDEARNKVILIMECMFLFHIVDRIFNSLSQPLFFYCQFLFCESNYCPKEHVDSPFYGYYAWFLIFYYASCFFIWFRWLGEIEKHKWFSRIIFTKFEKGWMGGEF